MKKFCQFLNHLPRRAYLLFVLPAFVGYFLWVINIFFNLPFHIPETRLLLVLIPLTQITVLLFLVQKGCQIKTDNTHQTLWFLVFIFSLFNLLFVTFLRVYFIQPIWSGFGRVQIAIQASIYILALLALMVLFSAYKVGRFYNIQLSDVLLKVRDYLRDIFSLDRMSAFPVNLEDDPLGKILIIVFMAACFVIGLLLRLRNLDGYPPHVDEYIHTRAVSMIIDGEKLQWRRAFLTVNVPVLISYRLFGISLWSSRFPMVVINMLGIFPLFALTKKVNLTFAMISVFLFISNPWIIGASQYTRDYAPAPLLFFLPATLLFDLLDWELVSIQQFIKKHWWRLVTLIIILIYIVLDKESVLKISISVYVIFGFIALLKVLKQNPPKWVKVGTPVMIAGLLLLIIERSRILARFLGTGTIVYQWSRMYQNIILNSRIHHWYSWRYIAYLVLLFSLILSLDAIVNRYQKNKFVVLFLFGNFLAVLFYLTLFVASPGLPARVRYGVLMEYWYVPLGALFLYILYQFLDNLIRRPWVTFSLFIIIVATAFINYSSINYLHTFAGGSNNITGNQSYVVEPAYQYLQGKLTENDVLMTDFVHNYDEINDQVFKNIESISYYNYVFQQRLDPLSVVDEHPQGWFALSPNTRFGRHGIPLSSFVHNGIFVEYIGLAGDIYLWQWHGTDQ
jgi:hypothetical protein